MGTTAVLELHRLAGEHKQHLSFEQPMGITNNLRVYKIYPFLSLRHKIS